MFGKKLNKLLGALSAGSTRKALLRFGVIAASEHKGALHGLGCQTVIDIGANRGQFALAARHIFPHAKILSFEPLVKPAAIFNRIFNNDDGTSLVPVAISTKTGEAIIHISLRDDSSSLLPITDKQNAIFPGTSEKKTAKIKIGRLNEFITNEQIRAPALLKLDVQGYELKALGGCSDLLHRFDFVYIECSFIELYKGQALANEVVKYLHQYDFEMCGIYNVINDKKGKAIQADFLFKSDKARDN